MTSLKLTVDAVDNAASYGISDKPHKKPSTTTAWIKSVLTREKTPYPTVVWTGRTEFTLHKVADILRDFLQPDSQTSLDSAAKSLLVLIPTDASNYAEVCNFGGICVELAEQIPYHHPSMIKLVQLLHYLSESPKFKYKYELAPREEAQRPFQMLWESIADSVTGPDEEDHDLWVNISAFNANLFATGIWGTSPGQALSTLRDALERKKPDEAWERDCKVMAAAQWILWHGQTLFKLIIYDHLEEGPAEDSNWWLGEELEDSKMTPRSIERWRFWKAGFEAAASEPDASDECKKVASKAAMLMGAFEQSMLF